MKHFAIAAITSFINWVVPFTAVAQESPLTCGLGMNYFIVVIKCDVHANNVKVEDAIVNRGNCEVLEKDPEYLSEMIRQSRIFGKNFIVLGTSYKFGDKFEIDIECNNTLEYSITANGRSWTWKTR